MASRDAVLQTSELAEHVFTYLEMKDLVKLEQACRQFRNLVLISKKLKQILFLEAATLSTCLSWTSEKGTLSGTPNLTMNSHNLTGYCGDDAVIVTINPALHKMCNFRRWESSYLGYQIKYVDLSFGLEDMRFHFSKRCKHMFVTQPPTKKIELRTELKHPCS